MTRLARFRNPARCNAWLDGRLSDAAAQLTGDDLRRDPVAFFQFVGGTLNHLLLVDRRWLFRFR